MKKWKKLLQHLMGDDEEEKVLTQPELEKDFRSFYQKLSGEIVSHIEYQTEMNGNVGSSATVVKAFNIDDYSKRVLDYFRERNLLSPNAEEIRTGSILHLLLLPPSSWNIALAKDKRERLFCATLPRFASETEKDIPSLIKSLHDRAKFHGGSFWDHTGDELCQAIRDAALRMDIEIRNSSGTTVKEDNELLRELVPGYIFESAGVRTSRDLKRTLSPTMQVDGFISLLLLVCFSVLMMVRPDIPTALLNAIAPEKSGTLDTAVFSGFAAFLMLWTLLRAKRYGQLRQKKKILLRLLSRAVSSGLTDKEKIRVFTLKRFDYKKKIV